MNDKFIEDVKAAIAYVREQEICLLGTHNEQDQEAEDLVMFAFLAGIQYVEERTKSPD